MTAKEKSEIKLRLGIAIQSIINRNKKASDGDAVTSLRKLAASSGVEYSIIQKITSGQKDPQFTTLVALAEGLEITITQLLDEFNDISVKTLPTVKKVTKKIK